MGRVYKRDQRWGIDHVDHRGKRVRKVVANDRTVALRILAGQLDAVEKMKAGLVLADPREVERPFGDHLTDYIAELERLGRDEMYSYILERRIENAAEAQRWERLGDASPTSIAAYLAGLARKGRSARTINAHRAELSAFFNWCVENGRLAANPCNRVGKSAVKSEKKRRALSVAEIRRLLDAAPPGRRTIYTFLIYTGLRRAEAAAVLWCHARLDVANPSIDLPPTITKSGRAESLPLVPAVADALRAHRGRAADRHPIFERIPSMDEFRADLKAAHIDEEDNRGRKVVLHSLRHSLATMLAQSQVPPAVAQRILRHRDIRLTLEVYTDEGLLPLAAAMNTLPKLTTAS